MTLEEPRDIDYMRRRKLDTGRDLYAQVETHEQFATLTRATERYLVQLQSWVDRQIPWPAISDLVHGYRLRTESGETRYNKQVALTKSHHGTQSSNQRAGDANNSVPSLFVWHCAGSIVQRPKHIFAICQSLYD